MYRINWCHCERPQGAWQSFKKDCFVAMLLTTTLTPSLVFASVAGEVNKANDLYKQGKFDDSLDLYEKALDQDNKLSLVKYDLGTALYKKGDYAKALEYLKEAAGDKNVKIKPKAEYNLGNVLYKTGMQKANTDVDGAIKNLQQALGQYVETVKDDPKDADAKFNEGIVKKEIERLKQQKQQEQQPSHTEDSYKSQQQNQKQQQQKQKDQKRQQNQQDQQDQQKNQQNQKDQQSKQDQSQQENQQKNSSQSSKSKAQQQKEALDKAEEDQKEMDRKQAEDLLEDYQENEAPKKLLNYMPKKIDDRPVLKDW